MTVGSVGLDTEFGQAFIPGSRSGVDTIDALLERLERDEFDLVAVGRALLADPEWATKILNGRVEALAPFHNDALKTLR